MIFKKNKAFSLFLLGLPSVLYPLHGAAHAVEILGVATKKADRSIADALTAPIVSTSEKIDVLNLTEVPENNQNENQKTDTKQVIVVGKRIEEYRAVDALTGTKTGALLHDLHFSITVIPRQLIDDRGLTFLGEALDNVSGTQRRGGYGGTSNFGAFIRGFSSGSLTLRNGFRDMGFLTLRDTANVERYEVLKGPSSILYGQTRHVG